MNLLWIFLFVLILLASKRTYKKYTNPITLFIGVNIGSIIVMEATSIIDHNVSGYIWVLTFIMFASFWLGTVFGKKRIVIGRFFSSQRQTATDIFRLRRLIVIYSVIFDVFAFYYLYHLNRDFGLQRLLVNLSGLNSAMQSGEFESGIYTYFIPIGVPLCLMILFYMKKTKKNIFLILQCILCFIPCISPRRDTLFFTVVMIVMYFATQNLRKYEFKESTVKKIKRAIIIVGVVVIAVWLMSYTQELMNKSSSIEFTLFGFKIPNALKDPIIYVGGNYQYLQKVYEAGDLNFYYPLVSSLRLLYRYVGPYLGSGVDTTSIFALGFYNIGNSTNLQFNTIPILYYVIKEAGIMFWMVFFVIGFISEKANNAVNSKESIGKIMLGLLQFDIIVFSFRSYNVIFLSYFLCFVYMLIAYFYTEKKYDMDNE